MKQIITSLLAFLALIFLWGCPSGIDYSIGEPGTEKYNLEILGVWETDNTDADVTKVKLTKKDDYSFVVEVIEKGVGYSPKTEYFTGWTTKFKGTTFLYFKPEGASVYYHYTLVKMESNSLTICDMPLMDKGVENITSTESLQKEIATSLANEEFFDEQIVYKRVDE